MKKLLPKLRVEEDLIPNLQLTGEKIMGMAFRRTIIDGCRLTGEEIAKKILPKGKFNDDENLRKIEEYFNECGWGKMSIVRASPEKYEARVKLLNSVIAENYKKRELACYCISGLLAGIFTYLSGVEVQCNEMKCIANKDKYCEFFISKREVLEGLEDWIKRF
jgi:predicted hydrocarbon binding protein